MEQKINQALESIKNATSLTEEEKPMIVQKIEEWREEKTAIADLTNALEEWWFKVEPIFADIGLV